MVERAISLHKLLRLITHGLGGEGYLNFEGNEFGHPEWLDFPREGNNNSFHYARRQFDLAENQSLRYHFLDDFDGKMQWTEEKYGWLHCPQAFINLQHEVDKVVAFERAGLLWIFNFHPTSSYSDYRVGVEQAGTYRIVINTDSAAFGGRSRVADDTRFFTTAFEWNNRKNYVQVYIPTRTAIVGLCYRSILIDRLTVDRFWLSRIPWRDCPGDIADAHAADTATPYSLLLAEASYVSICAGITLDIASCLPTRSCTYMILHE